MCRSLDCFIIIGSLLFMLPSRAAVVPSTDRPGENRQNKSKAWVDETSAFLSNDGGKQWIIGRSTTPCVSEREATEKACQDAARQMAGLLNDVVRGKVIPAGNREWFRRRILADLNTGRFIYDRSVSKNHKPYGDLWSAEILIDASNESLRSIGVEYSRVLDDERRASMRRRGSLVGLCAAILLIYAIVNSVTKGYFQRRLRVGAVLSLVVSACVIVGAFHAAG